MLVGLGERFELITPRLPRDRGGFVAVKVSQAQEWSDALRECHVFTDARGDALRFGPAPYLLDDEIDEAIDLTLNLYDKRFSR